MCDKNNQRMSCVGKGGMGALAGLLMSIEEATDEIDEKKTAINTNAHTERCKKRKPASSCILQHLYAPADKLLKHFCLVTMRNQTQPIWI